MIGRKMWRLARNDLSSRGDWYTTNIKNWDGQTFDESDRIEEGRFLTEQELKALVRKVVEMARDKRTPYHFEQSEDDIVKELLK